MGGGEENLFKNVRAGQFSLDSLVARPGVCFRTTGEFIFKEKSFHCCRHITASTFYIYI